MEKWFRKEVMPMIAALAHSSQFPALISTAVGYMGGTLKDPNYEQVCTGETGHAEVLQLEFDPAKTSYRDLLNFFWCAQVN